MEYLCGFVWVNASSVIPAAHQGNVSGHNNLAASV
jgi:hypothetical protein